ncbi:MAG: hypothetical protein IJ279_04765 [Clostridia bacterium]|nr:hypothetical protein [Clostridia bacterium]
MKMKKLIAGLICLATVLTVTAACSKDKIDVDDVTVYQTDAYGETVTNAKGENVTIAIEDVSVEYVTDDKGNKVLDDDGKEATILHYYVTDVDDKGNAVTNENKEPVTKEHTSANPEQTTVGLGNIQDIMNGDAEVPTVEVETLPEGTTIKENKKLLEKAFSSGKFYMDMSIKNELGAPMSMTFATNGSDIYFGFNVNLLGLKMGYAGLQKDGKSYAIDINAKKYCESDSSAADTSEAEDMMSTLVIDKNANYIQTSVVKSKGVTYICEEYKTEMGTSKYYFDQKTEDLKRIEHDNPEAKVVIVVNKFVKNPSASYFAIPSGYKKVSPEEFNSSFENVLGSLGVQQ